MKATLALFFSLVGLAGAQAPQAPNPTSLNNEFGPGAVPVYRITVVARTTRAINYNHRSGPTMIGFKGTALMPAARGEAKVESKQGVIKIDADMQKLGPAGQFGQEYLTYVLWAVTPEGRATNVGEILLSGDKSKLDATTELQSFSLIVTAEPYFAVTQPSDVVVMENFVRPDTTGTIEQVDAKYELLQRGQYVLNVKPADISAWKLDPKVPLEIYEARNAVQIARWTGAEQYAASTYLKAAEGLENAEGYLKGKGGKKPIGTVAREAVQMAEDARIISIKKMDEERLSADRQAGVAREVRAESGRTAAESETNRVTKEAASDKLSAISDADRLTRTNAADRQAGLEREFSANNARAAAESETSRVTREAAQAQIASAAQTAAMQQDSAAKMAAAQADATRLQAENAGKLASVQSESDRIKGNSDAKLASAQADADRMRADNDAKSLAAQTEANAKLAAAQADADRFKQESNLRIAAAETESGRLRGENAAQKLSAQADSDRAGREKKQLEADRTDLRAQLLVQFNTIMQTRDTARGLIVNMSDVLFDTAKFTLRPEAREKLAKMAGVISGHPGLTLAVEGHTDSVGTDTYNQKLSEERGGSVRDYLMGQGMAGGSVTAKGFGKTQPVASNETSTGRQQNRRVEIVISGDSIGSEIGR